MSVYDFNARTIDGEEIENAYLKKNIVNHERQHSGY